MAALLWIGLVAISLTVLVAGLMAYGTWRWNERSSALLARLEAARLPHAVARYDAREIEALPAPVQRYFRAALTDGQAIVTAVSIQHVGTFNMSATAEQWKPFTSSQRVITKRPGFVWDARVAMVPGLPFLVSAHVHDAYIAGAGLLHGAVSGLVTVVNMADTPDLARGELMRFFAEAAWYPTALLPSQGVRWEAVDDSSAHATLTDGPFTDGPFTDGLFTDGPLTLKLLFRFNAEGLIDTVRAEARGRLVDGKTVNAPWQGRYWGYALQHGMRVPQEGEVAWMLSEGPKPEGPEKPEIARPYWRGKTLSSSYEFTNSPAR